LGIPKKVLYTLYTVAIALFETSKSVPKICQASSSLMLLTNPAHQSALNARKSLVQNGYISVDKELAFTQALLRASSDCAKQSILWDHRRWLFKQLYPPIQPTAVVQMPHHRTRKWTSAQGLQLFPLIPLSDIRREFGIIRGACDKYPRNYHAWSHWHFIVDVAYVLLSAYNDYPQYLDVLADEFITLHHWVNQHVSDHTAIHHLCNISQVFYDLECRYPSRLIDKLSGVSSPNSLLAEHALILTTSYPSHESLWMYMRRVVAALRSEERKVLIDRLECSPVSLSVMGKKFFAWLGTQVGERSVNDAKSTTEVWCSGI
jgi:protein prenyltransferase alpha subunit repeat containing protein 1